MEEMIAELVPGRRVEADRFLEGYWGYTLVVLRQGEAYDLRDHPGFAALDGSREIKGALIYRVDGKVCEILALCAIDRGRGTGTRLVEAAAGKARRLGCRIIRVVTTNDNLDALGFYQKRGFRLKRLYAGAMDWVRALKPEVPLVGEGGIPLTDELELEMEL